MIRRLLCASALLAALVGTAWGADYADGQRAGQVARGTAIGGFQNADTSFKWVRVSTTGGLSVYDEDRDRDKVTLWQNIMSGTNMATTGSDSSGVLNVAPYRYLKLLLKVTPRGNAAGVSTTRLAIQFRECMNGLTDSSSAFPEYQYANMIAGQASGNADTLNFGHLVTGSATVAWSGEYVVSFTANRNAPGNSAAAVAWSYPNGIAIPLDSFYGRPARFNYLQVRIRNLTTVACDYQVHLLGFAQ